MTAFSPSNSQHIIKASRSFIFKAIGVAIAWTLLFKLNMWVFKSLEVNQFVSWIFLPAFIRILSVLLFGWAAVVGLIVGAIITSNPADAYHTTPYVLAMISGFGPMIAVRFCEYVLKLPPTLIGIRPSHLFIFALTGAFVNVSINGYYFAINQLPANPITCLSPMLIGDMLGSVIMLYIASFILKVCVKIGSN
jgi:hypothetical protein